MSIDWTRIPADQHAAIETALELARAGEEEPLAPLAPTTAAEAVQQWADDHYKGGSVTFERMVEALTVLAEWVDDLATPPLIHVPPTEDEDDGGVPVLRPGDTVAFERGPGRAPATYSEQIGQQTP